MNNRSSDILIIKVWEVVFRTLSRLSIFDLIMRYVIPKLNWDKSKTYRFVDIWVMGHTLLSIIAVLVTRYIDFDTIKYILFYYGLTRVFEIFVYQMKINLIDSFDENANVRSYRRTVICLIHNFIEIIFWFTFSYLFLMNWFDVAERNGSLIQAFYMSFVTMTTFGPPNFNINNSPAMGVIIIQSIIGLLMTLVSFARFLSMLPRPKTLDQKEVELESR